MCAATVDQVAVEQQAHRFGYRPELDGLRAVAVLMVIEAHAGYRVGPGFLGVNVFFVLSGFLITRLLLDELDSFGRVSYRQFYWRRILRLYPALLAACGVAAVCAALVAAESWGTYGREAAAALLYVQDFFTASGHGGRWLDHTWSLGVEEQFYLVWPVTLMVLARREQLSRDLAVLMVACAVLCAVTAAILGGVATYSSPFGSSLQLVAGAWLAVSVVRVPRGTWLLAVAAYLIAWALDADPRKAALFYGETQFYTFAIVLLLAWALTHQSRLLRHPLMLWIGRRSYGIYLYHLPIFLVLQDRVHASRGKITLAGLAISLLLAGVSYRWLETPFLRLKRDHQPGRDHTRTR